MDRIQGSRRGAPLARREEGEYSWYLTDEQRSQRRWIDARLCSIHLLQATKVCGIYGVVDPVELPDRHILSQMDSLLVHRGPDDGGLHYAPPVALGSRRLSILDLSPAGHQPMQTPDGRTTLVYNGEVYNFAELRTELQRRGVRFASGSDTEVVLHLLARGGADAVERLSGMFALALWDRDREELLLARDRFGVKPLYLYQDSRRFAFASELKALLALPGIDRTVDLEALGLYLTLGFVPGLRTLFTKIRKAAPATIYRFAHGKLDAQTYFWLRPEPGAVKSPLPSFESHLQRVLERHLVADVPLGVFLSGGLDSTALVAAIRELLGRRVKTFTIGFGDPAYSEVAAARSVAEHFGTEHRELTIEPDAIEVLPRIVWHLEEPLADSSILPLWFLCKMAREEVTVALAGEGGDETLAGYNRYFWAPIAESYARLPNLLRETVFPRAVSFLPEGERRGLGNLARRIRKFVHSGRLDTVERYLSWFALFDETDRRRLAPAARGNALEIFADHLRAAGTDDPLRQLQYVDISTMLVDDLLLKADKLSMAHSLELRVPYLDPELAVFAYNLPERWKISHGSTKVLLRRWLAKRAPRAIARRPKQGFEVPIGAWFRGDLEGHARDLLLGGELRERRLVSEEAVTEILSRHSSRETDLGPQIFALVVLEHFFRAFRPTDL
jgi:asparagine synthase (glutamine-hydrolysing)